MIEDDLINAGKYLARMGYVQGREGNLSAKTERGVLIKVTNVFLEDLTRNDLSLLDLHGNIIGGGSPSSEYRLHLEIYRRMPKIKYVIHTHPPYSTALSYFLKGIKAVTTESKLYLSDVTPIVPLMEPGTQELADSVVQVLEGGSTAAVMQAHGLVTIGEDLTTAVMRTIAVERCAQMISIARSMGATID